MNTVLVTTPSSEDIRHNISDDSDGEAVGIKRELPHPDYDDDGWMIVDIILLFLESPVSIDNYDLVKLNKEGIDSLMYVVVVLMVFN